MENSNDTIGNRTCNLPTCSAVPQPTAPQELWGHVGNCMGWGTVRALPRKAAVLLVQMGISCNTVTSRHPTASYNLWELPEWIV